MSQFTVNLPSSLATDRGKLSCFRMYYPLPGSYYGYAYFTAISVNYTGSGRNDLVLSSGSGTFCTNQGWLSVSNLRPVTPLVDTTSPGPLSVLRWQGQWGQSISKYYPPSGLYIIGMGFQPVGVSLGSRAVFANFYAGQTLADPRNVLVTDGTWSQSYPADPLFHVRQVGRSLSSVKLGRTFVGVVGVPARSLVFFAGGLEYTGGLSIYNFSEPYRFALDEVAIFNALTGSWLQTNLSAPRFGIAAAAVSIGGRNFVLFAGGAHLCSLAGSNSGGQCAPSRVQDNVTCSGQTDSHLSGCVRTPSPFTLEHSRVVDVYDVEKSSWDSVTLQLTEPRRLAAAASLDSRGLVLIAGGVVSGGFNNGSSSSGSVPAQYSSAVDIVSVTPSGSLSTSTASLSVARMAVAAAAGPKVWTWMSTQSHSSRGSVVRASWKG